MLTSFYIGRIIAEISHNLSDDEFDALPSDVFFMRGYNAGHFLRVPLENFIY